MKRMGNGKVEPYRSLAGENNVISFSGERLCFVKVIRQLIQFGNLTIELFQVDNHTTPIYHMVSRALKKRLQPCGNLLSFILNGAHPGWFFNHRTVGKSIAQFHK